MEIETYLRNQPKDEEFEILVENMTLSNFNSKNIDMFINKIFKLGDSDVKSVNTKDFNQYQQNYPPDHPYYQAQNNNYPNNFYPSPPPSNMMTPNQNNNYQPQNPHPKEPSPYNEPPRSSPSPPENQKNVDQMDDKEFESALDDFIKGLKDL